MYLNLYFPMYPNFVPYVPIFGAVYNFLVLFESDTVCPEAGKADSVDVIKKAMADLDQIDLGMYRTPSWATWLLKMKPNNHITYY